METIKNPDFYLSYKKAQFKTPVEVLRKNFRNLQKLVERHNVVVSKQLEIIKYSNDKNEKLQLVNELIQLHQAFNKKLAARTKQHNDHVDKLVVRVERLNHIQDLYAKYSHLTKKDLDEGLPKELAEFYREENNLLIVGYLLRQYNPNKYKDEVNPAVVLAKSLKLDKYLDTDVIQQGLKIRDQIINKKNLKLLKMWCTENKKSLQQLRNLYPDLVPDDIEFECDFQEFIEMINTGKYGKALVYARKNLLSLETLDKLDKISQGSSVIWSSFIIESMKNSKSRENSETCNYYSLNVKSETPINFLHIFSDLLLPKKWVELGDYFLLNFRLLYGMNQIPPLETMLNIGGFALKTKSCKESSGKAVTNDFSRFLSKTKRNLQVQDFINSTECPICSPELNEITQKLPYSLKTRSNICDDPVIGTNEYIYSFKQLVFLNRWNFQNTPSEKYTELSGIVGKSGQFNVQFINGPKIQYTSMPPMEMITDPMNGSQYIVKTLEKVFPT